MKIRNWIWVCPVVLLLSGCSATPEKAIGREDLSSDVKEAIPYFRQKDPSIQKFFDGSAGYAVLPKVYKGAFWLGGAYGKGQVFERSGALLGYCDMKQATIGFSFGGEFFREIIFFREVKDLQKFMQGNFALSAQATASAVTVGAAAKVDYRDGMAVFVLADAGLMVDASVGGQKFEFDSAPRLMN
jgi:lipid-binding SYLF domain-containing protein